MARINTKGVVIAGLLAGLIINISESILNIPVLGAPMEAAMNARNLPPIGCRFRDCRHKSEPGCALRTALATQQLIPERFEAISNCFVFAIPGTRALSLRLRVCRNVLPSS